MLFIEKEFW